MCFRDSPTGRDHYLGGKLFPEYSLRRVWLTYWVQLFCVWKVPEKLAHCRDNVGAVAVLMPVVIGISNKTKIPVSMLLIPLAFSSSVCGTMTLIGSPANMLAQDILISGDFPSFSFFEITPWG